MPSTISQTFTEFSNSIKDAYGHVVFGDDAGVYETYIFIARPRPICIHDNYTEKYNLGMTFIEVNGRAYVDHVVPNSDADLAGIKPQDCLQLATSPAWKFEGFQDYDDQCINYALESEKNGMRTSFDQMREIFEHCTVNQPNQELFTPSRGNSHFDKSKRKRTLTQKFRYTTQEVVGRCSSLSLNSVCTNLFSPHILSDEIHPIFMVFRHTQSRQKAVGNLHVGLPSFRLDDESKRAASIIKRLLPSSDVEYKHDAWGDQNKRMKPKTVEELDTVEASTLRGMIKNAVGLAFIRSSKVVLGLSFHFGSGIVISRLEDGSWSAPSAIGMYGAGLGFQFGLEVADYIFVIQTNEALNNFRNGTNYTFGGNMGAAIGGIGREAVGAASVSAKSPARKEKIGRNAKREKSINMAPIAAYAKSQGLYFGVSLEGSKMFVREDINHRTYQFSAGKECTTDEILSGVVPRPREAEDLYTTLHNVEFAHEISQLPRSPDFLQSDLRNNWRFDIDNMFSKNQNGEFMPLYFLSELSYRRSKELSQFESNFKTLMYEGVSVQQVNPGVAGRGNDTLDIRTLWLMLPEVGSLRLGFLSKSTDKSGIDQNGAVWASSRLRSGPSNDDNSTGSSTDRSNHVEGNLSSRFSVKLTNIISIERCPKTNNVTSEKVDSSTLIKIESVDGKILLFIANNVAQSVVLFCGLKLLVEKETARLGTRGGRPIGQLGVPISVTEHTDNHLSSLDTFGESHHAMDAGAPIPATEHTNNHLSSLDTFGGSHHATDVSINSETSEKIKVTTQFLHQDNEIDCLHSTQEPHQTEKDALTDSRNVNQERMRSPFTDQHSNFNCAHSYSQPSISSYDNSGEYGETQDVPIQYIQGHLLHKEIATNISLPLPLSLCRALFLDSNSPLRRRWETDRGDFSYLYEDWKFKSSSPRSTCQPDIPESELVASKMVGGHRKVNFERVRKGQRISLSETWIVDIDESDKLVFTIIERMPRRGFSIKIRVIVRPSSLMSCDVSMVGEFVPLGKNTSDQKVVHRAFLLVLEEVEGRYGQEEKGLLAGLLQIHFPFPMNNTNDEINVTEDTPRQIENFRCSTNTPDGDEWADTAQQIGNFESERISSDNDGWVDFNKAEQNDNIHFNETTNRALSKKANKDYKTNLTYESLSNITESNVKPLTRLQINQEEPKCRDNSKSDSIYEKTRSNSSGSNMKTPPRQQKKNKIDHLTRPATPSMKQRMSNEVEESKSKFFVDLPNDEFVDFPKDSDNPCPIKIDVKPLPKIRLDLMPSPREVDEFEEGDY